MLRKRKYRRLFLEKDIPHQLPAHDVFDLVSNIAHSNSNGISFAIFDRYYDAETAKFQQTVGVNRGMNVRIGGNAGELAYWLKQQPDLRQRPRIAINSVKFAFI